MQGVEVEEGTLKVEKKSIKRTLPNAFDKLSNKEKVQLYTGLYDENIKLRQQIKDKEERLRKKGFAPQSPKDESARLREKVSFLQTKMELMKSAKSCSRKKAPKQIAPSHNGVMGQLQNQRKNVNDLLAIIDKLKASLAESKSQKRQLEQNLLKYTSSQSIKVVPIEKPSHISWQQPPAKPVKSIRQKTSGQEKESQLGKARVQQLQRQNSQLRDQNINLRDTLQSMRKGYEQQFDRFRRDRQTEKKQQSRLTGGVRKQQQGLKEELQLVRRDKQRLEEDLRRLSESPFYQTAVRDNKLQTNLSQAQKQLQATIKQVRALEQQNIKIRSQAEVNAKQNQRLQGQVRQMKAQMESIMQQQFQREKTTDAAPGQRIGHGYQPSNAPGKTDKWRNLYFIRSYEGLPPEKRIQLLEQQKAELMSQLQKCQGVIASQTGSLQQRELSFRRKIDELEARLRAANRRCDELAAQAEMGKGPSRFQEVGGVVYQQEVEQFKGLGNEPVELGFNWFDLWLGSLQTEETSLLQLTRGQLKDPRKMMIFATADFYNHDTVHTKICNGTVANFNFKAAFKVQLGLGLLQYLQNESVVIELWASEGVSAVLLGAARIKCSGLVQRSHQTVVPVIHSKAPFYAERSGLSPQLIGTIEYKVRIRYPASQMLRWAGERERMPQGDQFTYKRVLRVQITRAEGLPSAELFAHLEIQGKDFVTKSVRGPSPRWEAVLREELKMGPALVRELRTNFVELLIFDIDQPKDDDIVARLKLDLCKLIEGGEVSGKFQLEDALGKKLDARVWIKVCWQN